MNSPRSPSLRQLAKHLGLSQAAVSYALRGSKKVSEQTRQKVLAAAEDLGYRPSAAMSAAMSAAGSRGRKRFQETVACITGGIPLDQTDPESLEFAGNLAFYHGLKKRAEERGCDLDFLGLKTTPPATIRRILRARGISRAIVISRGLGTDNINVLLRVAENIRCVFLHPVEAVWSHGIVVVPDLYAAGQIAFLTGWRAGYRQFIITGSLHFLNVDRRFEAGMRIAAAPLVEAGECDLEYAPERQRAFVARIARGNDPRHCFVGSLAPQFYPALSEALSVDEPPGWIDWHANIFQNHYPLTGIHQNDGQQAADALDICLAEGSAWNSTDNDDLRRQHLIHPGWITGKTLPGNPKSHAGLGVHKPFPEACDEAHEPLPLEKRELISLDQAREHGVFGSVQPPGIPPGVWIYHGIPFHIAPAPGRGNDHGFLLVGSPAIFGKIARPTVRIPVGRRARALYFFHMAAQAFRQETVANYRIIFQDHTAVEIPIITGSDHPDRRMEEDVPETSSSPNLQNWWPHSPHHNGPTHRPVCILDCDQRLGQTGYGYLLRQANPDPERVIQSIEIHTHPSTKAALLFTSLTLAS